MKKKILSIVLSFTMIFSTTGFVFADADLDNPPTEPTKPEVENYEDNDKIKEYNKEAEEYNKKVDEYNSAVDKEYDKATTDTNKKNEEGRQRQADSQKAYDDAVAANEAEQKRVDEENAKIDETNSTESEKVNQHNANENAEVERNKAEIEKIEKENAEAKAQYDSDVAAAEKEYEEAVVAEKERIEGIKAENEQIRQHNAEEDQKVADTEATNTSEKARIDAENAERESKYYEDVAQYEINMAQYQSDYEQYKKDKEMEEKILSATDAQGNQRYHSVEEYNEVVKNYNNQVTTYNKQVDTYNASYKVTDEIVNNSPTRNQEASSIEIENTYEIIKGDTESGRAIPVSIKHTFYGTDISYSEEFEIDANDTIILKGMSALGDCLNEESCLFFYNTNESHTLGIWSNSWSMLQVNPTAFSEDGWQNGDTHTITYKDSTNEYQWHFEDITVEYYYAWIPFYKKKSLYEYANVPNEPTEPTEPTLELIGFEPITYTPNYLKELDETENVIEKRIVEEPKYTEVPAVYNPNYKEYTPIPYINPVFIGIPDVETWKDLPDPVKREYLNHISLMDLFPEPEPEDPPVNPDDPPVNPEDPSEDPPIESPDEPTINEPEDPTSNNSNTSSDSSTPAASDTNYYITNFKSVNDETEVTDTTEIKTADTPLGTIVEDRYWALINLLAALATIIIGLLLIVMYIINKAKEDDDSEEKEYKNKGIKRIISVIIGVISIIIFFLTENINLPMGWVDQWTILMIIILIINIIMAFLSRRKEKEKEEIEEE